MAAAVDKIYTAYEALQTEYDQKVAQAQANSGAILIEGRNPALNREIEKRELKKLCITLLTGKHFNDANAMVYPMPPSRSLPEVDVLEALEEGPVAQFLQAGAARVVVPAPTAYRDAILYFLETGLIWEGGETPRLNDPCTCRFTRSCATGPTT